MNIFYVFCVQEFPRVADSIILKFLCPWHQYLNGWCERCWFPFYHTSKNIISFLNTIVAFTGSIYVIHIFLYKK